MEGKGRTEPKIAILGAHLSPKTFLFWDGLKRYVVGCLGMDEHEVRPMVRIDIPPHPYRLLFEE